MDTDTKRDLLLTRSVWPESFMSLTSIQDRIKIWQRGWEACAKSLALQSAPTVRTLDPYPDGDPIMIDFTEERY